MRIVRNWNELTHPPQRTVLTIGNFDGVHRGHQEVFRRLVERARAVGGTAAVYTFCPHPLRLLAPQRAPRLITTQEEKEQLIAACGIDLMLCPPFDRRTAGMSAADFVQQVLVERLGIVHLVVGADYAFGRGREGDVAFLRAAGAAAGFTVEALPSVRDEHDVCSSTRIRELIEAGQVDAVVPILGRAFALSGMVVHGDKRGRRLGFPTANLSTDKELLPASGVYAVRASVGEQRFDGVANIGRRPTYGGGQPGIEVHLLGFDGNLYDRSLRVCFIQRLRDERPFADSAALAAAIGEDVAAARRLLAAGDGGCELKGGQ